MPNSMTAQKKRRQTLKEVKAALCECWIALDRSLSAPSEDSLRQTKEVRDRFEALVLSHMPPKKMCDHSAYKSWEGARSRCADEKRPGYANYGGRGIKFDPAWEDFWQFVADMGERPPGMSLDRIDNDGDYTRSNCRWADHKTQQRNKQNTRRFEFRGQPTPLSIIAEETGMNADVLYRRLVTRGQDLETAINTPVRRRHAA